MKVIITEKYFSDGIFAYDIYSIFAYFKTVFMQQCIYSSAYHIFPYQSGTRLKAAVAGESREEELVLLCTVCFKCAKRNRRNTQSNKT